MAEPGEVAQPPETVGQVEYNKALAAGGPQLAEQYRAYVSQQLSAQGATPDVVAAYWGFPKPDPTVDATVAQNHARNLPAAAPKIAQNPLEAAKAGWDNSDLGLIMRGKTPDVMLPKDATLLNKVVAGTAQLAGDAPAAVAGFFGGAAAGAAVPGAGETGLSELAGGGFGSAALPQALRSSLITAYNSGNYKSSADLRDAVVKGTIDTLKAGVVGAVAAPIGGAVAGKVVEGTGSTILGAAANDATQTVVGATVGAALDKHLPEPSDFITGAIGALGNHAGRFVAGKFTPTSAGARVQSNLQKVYAETGIPPWEAVKMAKSDPKLMEELMTQDVNGEPVTPGFKDNTKSEPPPYGEPETGSEGWAAKRLDLAGPGVDRLMKLTQTLEGSGDNAVSPAGAIGKHQIMPGTARQYGFDPTRLKEPEYNAQVAQAVLQHLSLKYNGDEAAILAAYNAGPGRANELLRAGPGTRLEAERDPSSPGGWKYTAVNAGRDESFLPLETQRYIARGRALAGDLNTPGTTPAEGEEGAPAASRGLREPEWAKAEEPASEEEGLEKLKSSQQDSAFLEEQKAQQAQAQQELWDNLNAEFQRRQEKAKDDEWADKLVDAMAAVAKSPKVGNPDAYGDVRDAYDTIGSKIVDTDAGSAVKVPLMRRLGDMVSELNPAREIDKSLTRSGLGFDPTRDVGLEDVLRVAKGSYDKAAGMIKFGMVDPRTGKPINPDAPTIQKAFTMVRDAGGNFEDWERYMVSQRALGIEARGMKSGFDPNAAARVALDPGERDKYEAATRHFNDALTDILRYAQERGLYSKDQVDALVANNPTYLMFNRAQATAEGLARAKGLNPSQVKKLMGSDKPIVSPIQGTLWNVFNIVANADKNLATGYLVKLAEMGKLPESYTAEQQDAEAAPQADPTKILDASLEGSGEKGDTTFRYYRDGKAETWKTNDPDLARLFQVAPPKSDSPIIKLLSTFGKLERTGVIGDPTFPVRMMIRHQSMAYIMDPHNVTPFVHWFGGIMDAFGQGPGYKRLLATGGMGASMADLDVNTLHGELQGILDQTGFWDKALNVVGKPQNYPGALLAGLRFVQERLDAGARIGYQNTVIAKGIDPLKSAALSRKLFIDYSENSVDPLLNIAYSATPFLKTHLIGNKGLLDAFTAKPGLTSAKIAIAVALPVAAMYAANYLQDLDPSIPEDRKFRNLPRWEKDTMLITPEIAGQRVKIPLPPVLGPAIGGFMWRMLDASVAHDPEAFKGWSEDFLKSLIPDVTPTAIKPILEQTTNYSFWEGKPLVPASQQDLSPDMQHTPSTSAPAKALSRILGDRVGLGIWNVSPIAIDNYVNEWGGTLGQAALGALNLPFKDPGPPGELTDIPFIKGFLARRPGANAQAIQDFYDEEHKFTQAHADYAAAKQRMIAGLGDQEFQEMAGDTRAYVKVAAFSKALKVQQQVLEGVYRDPKMSTDEKRQRIEQTYVDMIETAKNGLDAMRSIDSGN